MPYVFSKALKNGLFTAFSFLKLFSAGVYESMKIIRLIGLLFYVLLHKLKIQERAPYYDDSEAQGLTKKETENVGR